MTDANSGSATALQLRVTDANSGSTTALPFSVTDANSGSTTALPFGVTDANFGFTTALGLSVTDPYSGSTTALPFNATDSDSDSSTCPAIIDPDTACFIATRAYFNDDPGPSSFPLPSLASLLFNAGCYSTMSDDRRFDNQQVDYKLPPSDEETGNQGTT